MKTLRNAPDVAAMLTSLRAMGYKMETALADLIDNSIAAKSSRVEIRFSQAESNVGVIDDGIGMDEPMLISAMRHGGNGPDLARDKSDLGRYGMGLKTASLSQCRQLTVVSLKEDGVIVAARWDLDYVKARNDWAMLILEREEITALPYVDLLLRAKHGTIILWSEFDHALLQDDPDALARSIHESARYLSLVFHRYLAPVRGDSKLYLSVNGTQLDAVDPFFKSNSKTKELPAETIHVGEDNVRMQAYILPHQTSLSAREHLELENSRGLVHGQGFYVYRNRRLIISGTWFGLLGQRQISKLARVQVDIPNTLDHLWRLDIKKSAADPPQVVRRAFRRVMDELAGQSREVMTGRRQSKPQTTVLLWKRQQLRGSIAYTINRDHPTLEALAKALVHDDQISLDLALNQIEMALPIRDIYSDMNKDSRVGVPIDVVESQLRMELNRLLTRASSAIARDDVLQLVSNIEPFSRYQEITKKLLQEI